MRNVVTKYHRLWLAGSKPRISPDMCCLYGTNMDGLSYFLLYIIDKFVVHPELLESMQLMRSFHSDPEDLKILQRTGWIKKKDIVQHGCAYFEGHTLRFDGNNHKWFLSILDTDTRIDICFGPKARADGKPLYKLLLKWSIKIPD